MTTHQPTDPVGAPRDPDAPGAPPDTPAPAGRVAWWRALLLIGIAVAVLIVDVITKAVVVATIDPGENIRILGGLVYLTQIRNAGAAFSMATGMTWVLAIIAFAVVAFIVRMAPRLRSTPWAVCLGLVLGGALGNLTDRVFRAPGFLQGHVVDFISVFAPDAQRFPAFNAADSAITIGGVMLVLIALLGYDFDGGRHRGKGARTAATQPDGGDTAGAGTDAGRDGDGTGGDPDGDETGGGGVGDGVTGIAGGDGADAGEAGDGTGGNDPGDRRTDG